MKNKKRTLIIALSVLIIALGIGSILIFNLGNNKKELETKNNTSVKTNVKKSEKVVEESSNIETKEENKANQNIENTKKESTNQKSNQVQKNNEIKTYSNEQSETKNQPTQITQAQDNNTSSTPWSALGISEYQYYNEPASKNDRVDAATYQQCIEMGENKTRVLFDKEGNAYKEYYQYSCRGINSHAGTLIGWMLELSK